MKKITFIIAAVLFISISLSAQTSTADEILEKYYKAVGMEQLVKQKSLKTSGKQMMQGMEFSFKTYQCRPHKMRVEVTAQGMTIINAVNGDKGFMINPMTGSNEPQDLPKEQLKAMKEQADMNGALYNYKEKGMKVELVGEEDVDGKKAYKLKVISKPENEGDKAEESYFFIDKESFLLIQTSITKNMNGQDMLIKAKLSDYKNFSGVNMPSVTETFVGTMSAGKVIIEKVEFSNEALPDSLFTRPE